VIPRPFFKYAGSKWQLSKHYPEPAHKAIVEPFAGSACYATRYYASAVTLNENNPEIAELWRYLVSGPSREIGRLPTTQLQTGQDIRDLKVSQGAKLLIRQWQRVGMSNCWTVGAWCNKPGQWGDAVRDHLVGAVSQIRHWKIIEGDYRELPNSAATFFIDPPYAGLPLYGSKLIDYGSLGAWCRSRRGQVIVCEQAAASWLPFREFRRQTTGRRGEASKGPSREGIWTNGGP
jgi:hypothetical protein